MIQDEIGKRFQKLSLLMMQLQSYGYPPEELTGSMVSEYQLDYFLSTLKRIP